MITNDDKALILLCSYLGIDDNTKPFSIKEWNIIANKIKQSEIKRPQNLFNKNDEFLINELRLEINEVNRIQKLLSRSFKLTLELDKLYSKGIKVVTRASKLYPYKLRKKLKTATPPVLFYCGNLELANEKGIGIVGSRKVKEEYLDFTKEIVKNALKEDLVIFSGGAKGIDSFSENEAFLNGGKYVSFLSDSLEKKIRQKDIRQRLEANKILLITANKPDAGFNVGFAMGRNKYIYSLADTTFIIASDYKKGGTWSGAVENLKYNFSNSFVRKDTSLKGNEELIKLGINSINDISKFNFKNLNLISTHNDEVNQLTLDSLINLNDKISIDIYDYFLEKLLNITKDKEYTLDELVYIFNLYKIQIKKWLERAINDNKIKLLENNKYTSK